MSELKGRSLAAIFLISSATLCLEISLTRYFSVSQYYHFAFWVVSIAFMGYGASGSFLTIFKAASSVDRDTFLSSSSLIYSLTILFLYPFFFRRADNLLCCHQGPNACQQDLFFRSLRGRCRHFDGPVCLPPQGR
jgi:bacteriorhodopsin